VPTGIALPDDCRALYSDEYIDMLEAYEGYELRLNRTDYEPSGVLTSSGDPVIAGIESLTDRLVCRWTPPPTNIGMSTSVMQVDEATVAAVTARLEEGGATCSADGSGSLCEVVRSDTEYALVTEWNYFEDGLWVVTQQTNLDPEGYRGEVLGRIFTEGAARAPLPAEPQPAGGRLPSSCYELYSLVGDYYLPVEFAEDPDRSIVGSLPAGVGELLDESEGVWCAGAPLAPDARPESSAAVGLGERSEAEVVSALESAGAACDAVRGGTVCTLVVDESESSVNFIRDGIWVATWGGHARTSLAVAADGVFGPFGVARP
jgi:hypothetical protein